jgi:hypothetical protein
MRLWRSAVVALALSSSFAVVSEAAAAPRMNERLCGALRGTAVYGIRAQGMRCPEARTLASLHERAVRRKGRNACKDFRSGACRVRQFWCSARVGLRPQVKDGRVVCGNVTNTKQVNFRYDHRKIRLPAPELHEPPPQEEQPPSVTPPDVPVTP